LSKQVASPEPGEEWRAYQMTPFGPGPIATVVRVIEVVQDLNRRTIVLHHQVYPVRAKERQELPLEAFINHYAAPYEDETNWKRRRR
jgi:hypothetical protein